MEGYSNYDQAKEKAAGIIGKTSKIYGKT